MYFNSVALFTLFSTTILAHPTVNERNNDLFDVEFTGRHAFPREAAFNLLPEPLVKRTSFPNLVPTSTVNLKTDSTGTAEVSPVRYGATTVSLAPNATPVDVTPSVASAASTVPASTGITSTTMTPSTAVSTNAGSSSAAMSSGMASSANVTGKPQPTKHHRTMTTPASSHATSSAPANSASGAGFQGTSSSSSGMGTKHGTIPLTGLLLLMIAGL